MERPHIQFGLATLCFIGSGLSSGHPAICLPTNQLHHENTDKNSNGSLEAIVAADLLGQSCEGIERTILDSKKKGVRQRRRQELIDVQSSIAAQGMVTP
jgi:hypothetical protein